MKCFLYALRALLTVSLCLMFAMLRYEFLRLSIVSGMRVFATIFLYLLVVGPATAPPSYVLAFVDYSPLIVNLSDRFG